MTHNKLKDLWLVCQLSPVLRLSLEADVVPVSTVALPLSLVLLQNTTAQLTSHHRTIMFLQDGTDWHLVCYRKICLRFIVPCGSCWAVPRSGLASEMWMFVQGNSDASASCIFWLPLSLSLFVLSTSGIRSLHYFYSCAGAISDPCCHSTITVHWHSTPSTPCLIPCKLEATPRRG